MAYRQFLLFLSFVAFTVVPAHGAEQIDYPSGAHGYLLIDANTGERLASSNEDQLFIPASTHKLTTALLALETLGTEHRFSTDLFHTGEIEDGKLTGDLFLRGGGDPELDLDDLLELALSIRHSGIHSVAGQFVIDDRALPHVPVLAPEHPQEAPYNAGINALALAFNRTTLHWDKNGTVFPLPPNIVADIQLELRNGSHDVVSPPTLNAEEIPTWRVRARPNMSGHVSLPIRNPALHTAENLRMLVAKLAIDLPQPVRGALPANAIKIATIKSQPLVELVRDMLHYSNNQLAEMIGLATTSSINQSARDLASSSAIHLRDLPHRLPGSDWSRMIANNHSGLDAKGRMSPVMLATILESGLDNWSLPALLPAAGWSGNLARRWRDPDLSLRVWAKSGSLDYASALAGYLMPQSGGLWIFVIMINDIDQRAVYDSSDRLTESILRAANSWTNQAKKAEMALVRRWLVQ